MVVVVASCVFFLLFNIINTVCNQINKCVFVGTLCLLLLLISVKNIQLDYSKKLLHVACVSNLLLIHAVIFRSDLF